MNYRALSCPSWFAPWGLWGYDPPHCLERGWAMSVALKKPRSSSSTAKRKIAAKSVQLISEVDVMIARLKKLRKGQSGSIDVRQAIEDGRA